MCKDTEVATGAPIDKRVSETTQVDSFNLARNTNSGSSRGMKILTAILGAATIGLLVSTIYLAVDRNNLKDKQASPQKAQVQGPNPCADQKPDLPNVACVIDAVEQTGEQSGANVTKGYQGSRETDAVPITTSYFEAGLCPVNVHWHLGAEHYSVGEFDETGTGPVDSHETRQGFQCKYYDENDPRFTTKYNWQHCIEMEVGQTYEVHWPHSAAGACGTPFQYQTPFYDGVFCRDGVITDSAAQIGVQAQVFTIINDEDYFYPDLFHGMIVEGERGTDVAKYTGSTTGTSRDNDICSPFTPITWQVDRKCHLISASSFDEMCRVMRMQVDNMNDDLHAHGSRELVDDEHAANNQQLRKLRG
jgi:hypothetical protein